MTAAERKARFDVALEIINTVYTDLCRDPNATKEHVYEFCSLVIEMNQFGETLKPNASLDDVIQICDKLKSQHVVCQTNAIKNPVLNDIGER